MREHPNLFDLQDDRDFSWSGQRLVFLLTICNELFIYPLKEEIRLHIYQPKWKFLPIPTEMKTSSYANWNENFVYQLKWRLLRIPTEMKTPSYTNWNENFFLYQLKWEKVHIHLHRRKSSHIHSNEKCFMHPLKELTTWKENAILLLTNWQNLIL